MPFKNLPANPDLDHLKHQVKDLIRGHQAYDPRANQRIREFHPRFRDSSDAEIGFANFTLADAQYAIAREYGFASWQKLKRRVERQDPASGSLPLNERIEDVVFRDAVALLDAGGECELRSLLAAHPAVVHQRVFFGIGGYFGQPTLLEFIAENPVRRGSLPANIVAIAKVILEAGAQDDPSGIDRTLELVSSGKVARKFGVQEGLIDLLCDHRADPNSAMTAALGHGEFAAVDALIRRGATLDLPAAAAMGAIQEFRSLLTSAKASERHQALAYAAQFGRVELVQLLLDAGEDPNRFNPVGVHSHSTPLHQAALNGHLAVVRLLIEHGADRTAKDILFNATPLGWAEHGGQTAVVQYLQCLV